MSTLGISERQDEKTGGRVGHVDRIRQPMHPGRADGADACAVKDEGWNRRLAVVAEKGGTVGAKLAERQKSHQE